MDNLNVFDAGYLPENFFNLLASPKKEFHVNFLYYVYCELESSSLSFKVGKSEFWDMMSHYITANASLIRRVCDVSESVFYDETAKRIFITDTTTSYVNAKWLEETYDISSEKYLMLLPHTVSFLSWIADIRNDNKPFLTGVIASIKRDLLSDDLTYETLQNLKTTCRDFKNDLLQLSTGMRKIIAGFLGNKSLAGYVSDLLLNMQSPYFLDYKKLKSDENISRYRYEIEDKLYSLATDEDLILTNLVNAYMLSQKERIPDDAFDAESERTYKNTVKLMTELYDFFKNTYAKLISAIELERLKYWRIATEQIDIARKHGESGLAQVQTIIAQSSESEHDLSGLFNLFTCSFVDQECIRKRLPRPHEKTIRTLRKSKISDTDRRALATKVLSVEQRFSAETVNAFMKDLMAHTGSITISDVPVKSTEDLTMLALIPIYCDNAHDDYSISSHDEYYRTEFGEIKNFAVTKKEKYNGRIS